MKNADLLSLKKQWISVITRQEWSNLLKRQKGLNAPQLRAAHSALLLLFASIDENAPDAEINQKLQKALTIAIKIDSKQLSDLDSTSKKLVRQLTQLMNARVENAYISSLEDAVKYLRHKADANIRSQTNHVKRVFHVLEKLHTSNQPIPAHAVPLEIKDGDETFRYFFHGENYPSEQERKETIERLYYALVTAWNDAVETDQLDVLINNIQSGPCIEGATRQALQVLIESIAQKTISSDFDSAMGLYYSQAEAMLAGLHLPTTQATLRDIIVAAYNGTHCLPRQNRPDTVSAQSVEDVIKTSQLHETKFTVNDDSEVAKAKQAIQAILDPLSMVERKLILETLNEFAPPDLLETLSQINYHNNVVLGIAAVMTQRSLTNREVRTVLASMNAADMFNLSVFNKITIFGLTAAYNQDELLEALLESKKITLNLSRFYSLTLNLKGIAVLSKMLQQNPSFYQAISAEMLGYCQPGNQSPFYFFTKTHEGLVLLKEILQRNPALYQGISASVLCRTIVIGEHKDKSALSALLFLSTSAEGIAFLTDLLQRNPALIQGITAEALSREWESSHQSPFYFFTKTHEGLVLLKEILQRNPALYQGISASALCRPVVVGEHKDKSALSYLSTSAEGIAFLTDLLQRNPALIQGITAEALSHEYGQEKNSPLANMMQTEQGQAFLTQLVEGNRTLTQHPKIEEAFRQITHKRSQMSPTASQMFLAPVSQAATDSDASDRPAKKGRQSGPGSD